MAPVIKNQAREQQFGSYPYARLHAFFGKVWVQKHKYKVAMARRCFNLNFMLAETAKEKTLSASVISQNALLLYADEIAEYYLQHQQFPSILVTDDTFLFGRAISSMLYTLEELVISHLESLLGDSQFTRYYVHCDLVKAVDIYVFAMNANANTVENAYLHKVKAEYLLYDDAMLQLSMEISEFIEQSDAANTSYTLSTRIRNESLQAGESTDWWQHVRRHGDASRHSDPCDFYFRFLSLEENQLIQAVQKRTAGPDNILLSGISFFSTLSKEQLGDYCGKVDACFADQNKPQCQKLRLFLRSEQAYLYEQQTQLISFFLSLLCLYEYFEPVHVKSSWEEIIQNSDLAKISANFFTYEDRNEDGEDDMLGCLCKDQNFIQSLRKVFFSENSSLILTFPPQRTEWQNAIINQCAEDIFCEAGMKSDIEAYEYNHNIRQFDPLHSSSNIISLDDYRQMMCRHVGAPDRPVKLFDPELLACALELSHRGIISIAPKLNEDRSGVMLSLKAGELSTYMLPLRYQVFLPSMALVERRCWRLNKGPEIAVLEYIDWLRSEDCASEQEAFRLKDLKQKWPAYQYALYQCRRQISRWNMIWSAREGREPSEADSIRERQVYYWQKAQEFLHI